VITGLHLDNPRGRILKKLTFSLCNHIVLLSTVNQLRIGTAIPLGISSSIGPKRIEGFCHDTFILDAEFIEVKQRNRPIGILSLGQLDTEPEHLFPTSPGVGVVEASSDHTVVGITESPRPPKVGDRVSFHLGDYALSRLMISPYVKIEYRGKTQ